ncbi:MAG TPA: GNAT family protein [Opitutaceae bacterium]
MQLRPVTLAGRHVRLEPIAEQHVVDLVRHAADPEIWIHFGGPKLDTAEVLRARIEAQQGERERGQALTFAVVSLSTSEAVGTTTYFDVSVPDRRLEIGSTWLGRSVWRTAVNTECKRLLLGHAFESLDCLRVQLKTDILNIRSQTAIARLGAVREGVLRAHMRRRDGTQRDTVMYSIIAEEWPAVKARLEAWLAA